MIELLCSDALRPRLERELDAVGLAHSVTAEGSAETTPLWVLVERGHPAPERGSVIVFDALDYIDIVRLLASGVRGGAFTARTLVGQRDDSFIVLTPREVILIEATPEGVVAVTGTGERVRLRTTLQRVEADWRGAEFVRANRSQLVNLAQVREIVPWFNSRYVLRLPRGNDVEVSKMYAKQLRETLGI